MKILLYYFFRRKNKEIENILVGVARNFDKYYTKV